MYLCSDCGYPCINIGCMGLLLCCDCHNVVYPDNTYALCEICKITYKPYEVINEKDDERRKRILAS